MEEAITESTSSLDQSKKPIIPLQTFVEIAQMLKGYQQWCEFNLLSVVLRAGANGDPVKLIKNNAHLRYTGPDVKLLVDLYNARHGTNLENFDSLSSDDVKNFLNALGLEHTEKVFKKLMFASFVKIYDAVSKWQTNKEVALDLIRARVKEKGTRYQFLHDLGATLAKHLPIPHEPLTTAQIARVLDVPQKVLFDMFLQKGIKEMPLSEDEYLWLKYKIQNIKKPNIDALLPGDEEIEYEKFISLQSEAESRFTKFYQNKPGVQSDPARANLLQSIKDLFQAYAPAQLAAQLDVPENTIKDILSQDKPLSPRFLKNVLTSAIEKKLHYNKPAFKELTDALKQYQPWFFFTNDFNDQKIKQYFTEIEPKFKQYAKDVRMGIIPKTSDKYAPGFKNSDVIEVQVVLFLRMWGYRDAKTGDLIGDPETGEIYVDNKTGDPYVIHRHHYKFTLKDRKIECWIEVLVPLTTYSHGSVDKANNINDGKYFTAAVDALMSGDLNALNKALSQLGWKLKNRNDYLNWLKKNGFK